SLNGNLFVTPRVIFGMAREGLAPAVLARVNRGGTPWAATLLVGAVVVLLAATGTFQSLLGLAVTVIIVIDGFTVLSLFRLRARRFSCRSSRSSRSSSWACTRRCSWGRRGRRRGQCSPRWPCWVRPTA